MLIGSTNENQQTKSLTALHSCITGQKNGASSKDLLLRPGSTSLTQLLQTVCPRLKLAAEQSTLLVDDVPVKCYNSIQESIDSAGINDNSMLTVVARQLVSLRCHYVIPTGWRGRHTKQGRHYMGYIQFEAGQRLGETWSALPNFSVCSTDIRPFHSHSRYGYWP